MIEKFVELLHHPNKLKDNRMFRFTLWFVVLIFILGILNIISYILFQKLLLEVQDIFFSNGAVSDIMQTV